MQRAYDVAGVRAAESALMATLPEGTLMARAACGLATAAVDVLGGAYGARVVLLVGSGDNGSDALLAGARLARRGARVDAVLVSPRSAEYVEALRAAGGRVLLAQDVRALSVIARADLVVDGIVGIGGIGGVREPAASLVEAIPSRALVMAVDLPSGVDADTGVVAGVAVRADLTVCMGVLKPGLLIDPGATYAGALRVIDIGLGTAMAAPAVEALTDDDVQHLLGTRDRRSDKYSGGVVGIVAGSATYPGAAVLAVAGAVASGAGYVRFVGDRFATHAVQTAFPEVVCQAVTADGGGPDWSAALASMGRVQAWVVGPGAGTDVQARERVEAVLRRPEPALLDADALTCLAASDAAADNGADAAEPLKDLLAQRTAATLLTPHAGELARLVDEPREAIEAHRYAAVTRAADALHATVLLKGSTTVVAAEAQHGARPAVRVNTTGTAVLATAGTGDVLSGLAGALLARGLSARDAASVAAHLHGRAAQQAGREEHAGTAITASRIAQALGVAVPDTDERAGVQPVG